MPEAIFHYNRFIEFVNTGSMPVSDNRHTIQQTITVLLSNKADWQTAANRVVLLRLLFTNQQALERLIRQCGDIVEEIMHWLNERPIQEAPFYTKLSAIPDGYSKAPLDQQPGIDRKSTAAIHHDGRLAQVRARTLVAGTDRAKQRTDSNTGYNRRAEYPRQVSC